MRVEQRLCCIVLPLALAACGGDKAASQGTAGGEVLAGSVSDAMIPTDEIRSQPPLAEASEADAATDGAPAKPGGAAKPKHAPRAGPPTAAGEKPPHPGFDEIPANSAPEAGEPKPGGE